MVRRKSQKHRKCRFWSAAENFSHRWDIVCRASTGNLLLSFTHSNEKICAIKTIFCVLLIKSIMHLIHNYYFNDKSGVKRMSMANKV